MSLTAAVRKVVVGIRAEVAELHRELPRHALVTWTQGNVSARVPDTDLLVIKPSGVAYEDLTPGSMVVTDLTGALVDGAHEPSFDALTHGHVYAHLGGVGGVVHTHSRYASAWCAIGEPVPCCLTTIADEFGGDVPIGPYARLGDDDAVGRAVVSVLASSRSRAVLMRAHGVFTVGRTAREAVKAAVMCEEAARVVWMARQLGPVVRLPQSDVDACFERYQALYGQRIDHDTEADRVAAPWRVPGY